MLRKLFAAACAAALVAGAAAAADAVVSGPQVGKTLPGPFSPLNINGEAAGKKNCLYCSNGDNPVVMIFARNPECKMTKELIKKVDACTAKHEDCDMGAFAVFCTDESAAEDQLKAMAKKADLKKVVLAVDGPAGPAKYKFSKDADVTAVVYYQRKVLANHTFKAGEMKEKDIEKILADAKKAVEKKKADDKK